MTGSTDTWASIILSTETPRTVWQAIFDRLREIALADPAPAELHRDTIVPDRLLAESAWSLWQDFAAHAPKVIERLREFWTSATASGTAALILDGLSLRELPLIVNAAKAHGITPARIEVCGAEVPTETDQFAAALGIPARSKLYNNKPPGTFIFAGSDTYTDIMDAPFEDCVASVPTAPRVFLWHKWPDEPLIHLYEDNKNGHTTVASETRKQLASDGFWAFINRMRKGRRLVITADHGYAVSQFFSNEVKDDESIKLLRDHLHASRCAREDPGRPWPCRHLPPLVVKHDGWLVVMGQRKWKVQGGFPHLCHRGLSLLEAAVPFVELPPM
ncbi:MAG: hypothetical protein V2A79_13950 [Planctomycetota bacterium]